AHLGRAMSAADAGIAAVVQRIVRNVVSRDVLPHLRFAPASQWIDLHEPPLIVPFDDASGRALESLIAANRGDPRAAISQCFTERLELSQAATKIRISRPQLRAKFQFLLFGCEVRRVRSNLDLVALFYAAAKLVGFGKQERRIEEENIDPRIDLDRHIDERDAFGSEARCQS